MKFMQLFMFSFVFYKKYILIITNNYRYTLHTDNTREVLVCPQQSCILKTKKCTIPCHFAVNHRMLAHLTAHLTYSINSPTNRVVKVDTITTMGSG